MGQVVACTPLVGTRDPVLDGAVVVNYKDDPDGFCAHQMKAVHDSPNTDGDPWMAAQTVAWVEIANRLQVEQMGDAAGMVLAWAKHDPQHVKKVRRGIRQLQKQRGVM